MLLDNASIKCGQLRQSYVSDYSVAQTHRDCWSLKCDCPETDGGGGGKRQRKEEGGKRETEINSFCTKQLPLIIHAMWKCYLLCSQASMFRIAKSFLIQRFIHNTVWAYLLWSSLDIKQLTTRLLLKPLHYMLY